MEKPQISAKAPLGELIKMNAVRFGIICSNLSMLAMGLFIASLMTAIGAVVWYVLLVAITIFTVGFIFLVIPNFKKWWNTGFLENSTKILSMLSPYFIGIAFFASAISVITLILYREKRHIPRIILGIIIGIISGILFVGVLKG